MKSRIVMTTVADIVATAVYSLLLYLLSRPVELIPTIVFFVVFWIAFYFATGFLRK